MMLDAAREVADAVLYEGYVLYPYRKSAQKNQARWQWGVLAPPAYVAGGSGETDRHHTELLAEPRGGATLTVLLRFLHLQHRQVERAVGEGFTPVEELGDHLTWDEAVEREIEFTVSVAEALADGHTDHITIDGDTQAEPIDGGRIVRRTWPLAARVDLAATPLEGPFGGVQLRIDVANTTAWLPDGAKRPEALRHSLIGTHTILTFSDGRFLSVLDPPEWASLAAEECTSDGSWPVLVGQDRRVMLCSPIILPDQPEIAPESPGPWYDGLEIDELLVLRTQTLTEQEKAEARRTDPRAARIIDQADHLPGDLQDRLHGAVRTIEDLNAGADPETDQIRIGDQLVGKGDTVKLNPGNRRADAQDMFLTGRPATVEGVFFDLDDQPYLAVTVDDDPGAGIQKAHGRYLYFQPDEVIPT